MAIFTKKELNNIVKLVDSIKCKDFGMRKAGEIIPEHQAYYPEYSLDEFKRKLEFFIRQTFNGDARSGMKQIEGLLETVLNDYKADISNKNLDKAKTLNFYKNYSKAADQIVAKYRNIPGPMRDLIETRMYNIK